jgi:hypothetical protein
MMGQFFDVVHQAVQVPLGVHLLLSAQSESIEPLVCPQVAEHWLDGGHAPTVQCPPLATVDGLPHAVRMHAVHGYFLWLLVEERNLTHRCAFRIAQALRPQCARATVLFRAGEFVEGAAFHLATAAVAVELTSSGANATFIRSRIALGCNLT